MRLLVTALAATVAASAINVFAIRTSQQRFEVLDRVTGAESEVDIAVFAQPTTPVQWIGVALIAAAIALTAAAVVLHFRRPVGLDRWVTVCAWTRRVHWQGRWVSFEEYLAQRFDLRCTHGICEEEAERIRRLG